MAVYCGEIFSKQVAPGLVCFYREFIPIHQFGGRGYWEKDGRALGPLQFPETMQREQLQQAMNNRRAKKAQKVIDEKMRVNSREISGSRLGLTTANQQS